MRLEDMRGFTLDSFRAMEDNWNGYGEKKPTEAAIATIEKLLTGVNIIPSSNGGMSLEWAMADCNVSIDVLPDGTIEDAWLFRPEHS